MAADTYPLDLIGVRRWGEDDTTPVTIEERAACGTWSDHFNKGCIGIEVYRRGASGLIHLTPADALRLSDLLRALADPQAFEGGEQ